MATPAEKLAKSLIELKKLQDMEGFAIIKTSDLSRTHQERLVSNGFIRQVIKGWYISIRHNEEPGSTTSWYSSFWKFATVYLRDRFNNDWCLSPEQSLQLHSGNWVVPKQLLIRSPKAQNNITSLIHGTSFFDLVLSIPAKNQIEQIQDLNVYSLSSALVKSGADFFSSHPLDARICLYSINDPSDLLTILLEGGHSVIAGRIAGAFRNIDNDRVADEILKSMKSAGYEVRENDPFKEKVKSPPMRDQSPYVNRIRLLWQEMRQTIIERFPVAKKLPQNSAEYLKRVEEKFVTDAYHSLSIEGYNVTEELIEKVSKGLWDPDANTADHDVKNALAARGYWQAFQLIKESIRSIIEGENPGSVVDNNLSDWYRELFSPGVTAGILKPSDLAGYRNTQVYISNSNHTPLNKDAVRDTMPVFFELLIKEENYAVRSILGHFIFVYIHPYIDGNGRIARFIMNIMLASGGGQWTVIPIEKRDDYMAALEEASVNQEISKFAEFIANLLEV